LSNKLLFLSTLQTGSISVLGGNPGMSIGSSIGGLIVLFGAFLIVDFWLLLTFFLDVFASIFLWLMAEKTRYMKRRNIHNLRHYYLAAIHFQPTVIPDCQFDLALVSVHVALVGVFSSKTRSLHVDVVSRVLSSKGRSR
jgi:Gpi18-like mannosyltransferase